MTVFLKLEIIDFDTFENDISNAISKEEIIFSDDKHETAYKKINDYLYDLTFHSYLAWDRNIYPQFKVSILVIK